MQERLFPQLTLLLLIATALGCSVLRPKPRLKSVLILEVVAPASEQAAALDQTMRVITTRLDLMGVSNCEVRSQSNSRILVSLPDVPDPERLKHYLTAGGRLELAHVVSPPSPAPVQTFNTEEEAVGSLGGAVPPNRKLLPYSERDDTDASPTAEKVEKPKRWVVVEWPPIVDGRDLRSATATQRQAGGHDYVIQFSLKPTGADKFGAWTGANVNQYMGVVLNDQVKSIAYIKSQIFDQGEITGSFTKHSAEDLAHVLRSGALPAPVKVVGEDVIK